MRPSPLLSLLPRPRFGLLLTPHSPPPPLTSVRALSLATVPLSPPPPPALVANERDLRFQLYDVLKVEETLFTPGSRFENASREVVNEALGTAVKMACEEFAPHYRKNDLSEPSFDSTTNRVTINPEVSDALKSFYGAGFGCAHADFDHGGLQLPSCVTNALMFPFYASNIGTVTFPFLSIAAGNMLKKYGTQDQLARYLTPMYDGRFTGTMNLSETQAGSSLGDILTKAHFKREEELPVEGGKKTVKRRVYSISGNKMWISGGEHSLSENIVHMVLAKVVNPKTGMPESGVKGISLFIVPKKRVDNQGNVVGPNDVTCGGLNHKLGWRGATNCVMNYGENGECEGELLGEEGKGLAVMFMMMNEARVSVGLIATALGYAGFAHSLKYAKERKQGRPLEGKDPNAPQTPIINHPDVKRMLLAQKSYVEGSLALCLYASWLVDVTHHPSPSSSPEDKKKTEDCSLLLDVLTPIVKSFPSEWCLEANKWAIQIHGGYGYTRDFLVEQHYRDNRLNMIHEGTNGIQSLDLLGRKVTMKNGAGLKLLLEAMDETVREAESSSSESLKSNAKSLKEAMGRLEKVTGALVAAGKTKGPSVMLANSHEYLNMTGFTVIAWMLLRQEIAAERKLLQLGSADSEEAAFLKGKALTSAYFFQHELPRTKVHAELLGSLNDLLVRADGEVI